MRILYLADIRFPLERANGQQTFETCRALAARGHAVTLVVRTDTMRPGRDPYLFYGGAREASLTISRVPSLPGAPLRRGAYLSAAIARAVSSGPDVLFTRDLGIADLVLRLPRTLRPPVVFESHGYAPVVAIERPAALKGRIDQLMTTLGSRLPSFRRKSEDDVLLLAAEQQQADAIGPAAAPNRNAAGAVPKSASGSRVAEFSGPASLLELVNQSFEVMQTSLAQYKIAGYPPDILINVPKRVCRFFEFYKAPELIMLGRQIARDTLERYEREG